MLTMERIAGRIRGVAAKVEMVMANTEEKLRYKRSGESR